MSKQTIMTIDNGLAVTLVDGGAYVTGRKMGDYKETHTYKTFFHENDVDILPHYEGVEILPQYEGDERCLAYMQDKFDIFSVRAYPLFSCAVPRVLANKKYGFPEGVNNDPAHPLCLYILSADAATLTPTNKSTNLFLGYGVRVPNTDKDIPPAHLAAMEIVDPHYLFRPIEMALETFQKNESTTLDIQWKRVHPEQTAQTNICIDGRPDQKAAMLLEVTYSYIHEKQLDTVQKFSMYIALVESENKFKDDRLYIVKPDSDTHPCRVGGDRKDLYTAIVNTLPSLLSGFVTMAKESSKDAEMPSVGQKRKLGSTD